MVEIEKKMAKEQKKLKKDFNHFKPLAEKAKKIKKS